MGLTVEVGGETITFPDWFDPDIRPELDDLEPGTDTWTEAQSRLKQWISWNKVWVKSTNQMSYDEFKGVVDKMVNEGETFTEASDNVVAKRKTRKKKTS